MPGALTWQNAERCVVGATTFQVLPADLLERAVPRIEREGADFLLFKEPPMVERYVRLVEELRPQRIVELGIMEGGGTALLMELADPRRMVAIDCRPPFESALPEYIARRQLESTLRTYVDVDQADRRRLAEIAEEAFGSDPLDLVVDDCSHYYAATRASFNELFPRLRPSGRYVIEDWPWAHEKPVGDLWADQIPLSRLIVELVLASACAQDVISGIVIDADAVELTRGNAEIAPLGFDVLDCLDQRARGLLVGDERVANGVPASAGDRGVIETRDAALLEAHLRDSLERLPGPAFYNVLSWIHRILEPHNYVEIGVHKGVSLVQALRTTPCIGIDPEPSIEYELPTDTRIFKLTSDEFFARHDLTELLGGPVELAFIDGLHLFEQVLRDFVNLEQHAAANTVFLLHDCLPLDEVTASRERTTDFYCGDVWKAVLALRRRRPDLRMVTVRTAPSGLCLVQRLDRGNHALRKELTEIEACYRALDFDYYLAHRQEMPEEIANERDEIRNWLRPSPER